MLRGCCVCVRACVLARSVVLDAGWLRGKLFQQLCRVSTGNRSFFLFGQVLKTPPARALLREMYADTLRCYSQTSMPACVRACMHAYSSRGLIHVLLTCRYYSSSLVAVKRYLVLGTRYAVYQVC